MNDLEIAKKHLHTKQAAIAIVKSGEIIFETCSHRISGFLEAIDRLGSRLENSSIADRVAGKAVALLCVYIGVKAVYADVLSKKAKAVFDYNGIACSWGELVENILDANKSKLCPFEEKAIGISHPNEAYQAFKNLQKTLSKKT